MILMFVKQYAILYDLVYHNISIILVTKVIFAKTFKSIADTIYQINVEHNLEVKKLVTINMSKIFVLFTWYHT